MEQHFKDNATGKLHLWLITVNIDGVIVQPMYGDAMTFDCWGDVEYFEMELVQKHEPKLNTSGRLQFFERKRRTNLERTVLLTPRQTNQRHFPKSTTTRVGAYFPKPRTSP